MNKCDNQGRAADVQSAPGFLGLGGLSGALFEDPAQSFPRTGGGADLRGRARPANGVAWPDPVTGSK